MDFQLDSMIIGLCLARPSLRPYLKHIITSGHHAAAWISLIGYDEVVNAAITPFYYSSRLFFELAEHYPSLRPIFKSHISDPFWVYQRTVLFGESLD